MTTNERFPESSEAHSRARTEQSVAPASPRFYNVAQVAEMLGMAPVTLYRAIRAGQFPAVRIRGRLIVPAKAVDVIVDAAVADAVAIADEPVLPDWASVPAPRGETRS